MKNLYVIFALAVFFSACQKRAETKVDLNSVTEEVNTFMEKNKKIWETNDTTALKEIYADELVIFGTDPYELWTKRQYLDEWKKIIAEGFIFEHSDIKRDIRVAKNGKSAMVSEQYFIPMISSKFQVRAVFQVEKNGDKWLINYLSWAIIPRNEDIEKLNAAL